MLFSSTLSLFSVLALAHAATYTVTVGITETDGHQGLGFDPSAIVPAVGDTVEFTFQVPDYIKNPVSVQHSATQSTLDNPCTPKPGGFDTGLQTTGATGPSFSLAINDTEPLFFYSFANKDCNSGMVLGVNAGSQLVAFQQSATTATINTPSSQSSSPSSSSSGSPSGSGSSSGTNTATGSGPKSSNTGSALSTGFSSVLALAALAVGAIAL